MVRAGAALRSSAAVAALVLTTACLPGSDGEGSEATAKGGAQLTEEEARAALPGKDELPSELGLDGDDVPPRDSEASSYPTTCRDVELKGEEGAALEEHITAKAGQNYAGENGGVITVTVTSHDRPVPGALFDDAGAAESTCAEFSKTDNQGTTKWKIVPSNLAPMGERTYVTGLEMLEGDELFTGGRIQLAGVAIGHNLVYIVYSAGPYSELPLSLVETVAQTTVENLEEG